MTSLHQQIRRTCRRHGLLPPGTRVLIGLSGGSDSVALTRLLLDLAQHGEFTVAGLAHLHHGLRPSADRDEAFCREFAAHLPLPIVVERVDVRSYAEAQGFSIEDAARRLRYDFLERTAASVGADRIAVGHTQDDQAETFLLKLMRGAGLTGLGGIYPRRDRLIRPLLDVPRADLRAYLAGVGERWIEDESNEDLDIPRNRVRHRVLPELDLAAGGPTRATIARAAAVIREDAQWLDELSRQHLEAAALETDTGLELDVRKLMEAPPPVRRRVLLEAMRRSAGGREVGLDHVEAVLALIRGDQGGVDVPGCRVERRGGQLVVIPQKSPLR
ncbi:MAG: tRNA lysidine(34) synthetase TilS [Acidobacteria bacterium]|nr:tRNA lysidine(34) synthetase TilS [Acidobacteriota bacterium]